MFSLRHPSHVNDLCCFYTVVGLPSKQVQNPKFSLTKEKISSYASHVFFVIVVRVHLNWFNVTSLYEVVATSKDTIKVIDNKIKK